MTPEQQAIVRRFVAGEDIHDLERCTFEEFDAALRAALREKDEEIEEAYRRGHSDGWQEAHDKSLNPPEDA